MTYTLHIGNKNYSSWSLRPWVIMKELNIPFTEVVHPFGDQDNWRDYEQQTGARLVPCLQHSGFTVWDSLAIIEYLAELHAGVWPENPGARAWARSVAAEMHSGFMTLRSLCSMNCGVRATLKEIPSALDADLARVELLWQEGLNKFGGPFLAGDAFSAVDAFYAPLAFRLVTYGLTMSPVATQYYQGILATRSMQAWYRDALAETFRDQPHDDEMQQLATITEDLRASS
jgi:glutathione S-transferase